MRIQAERNLIDLRSFRRSVKQVVYRFNAKPENDQLKVDKDDEIEMPSKDDVLEIDGNKWKVNAVMTTPRREGANSRRDDLFDG
jgi:hypothetical protein